MEYIQVIFKDKVIRYNTEKIHVWNVFDEFATLLNIKRYENETNAELYNRILVTSGYVINSSDNGIKNAGLKFSPVFLIYIIQHSLFLKA